MSALSTAAEPFTSDDLRRHTSEPWPLPASGDTAGRWHRLAAVGELDLALAKVVEPHHDAVAILADLGSVAIGPDDVWAVWASEPPFAVVEAENRADGWVLSGSKAFCSGAGLVTHALVSARTQDGARLFAVDMTAGGITPDPGGHPWVGTGMERAGTVTLRLDGVPAEPVGAPGAYTDRAGFWWGAIGVAAVWWGGTRGVAETLENAHDRLDAHGLAHLGAVRADLEGLGLMFDAAARAADDGQISPDQVERLALVVRQRAADVAESVVSRVGRALGPGPLAFDEQHARRVADLQVFVRQHHAERDLARLGSLPAPSGRGSADA